MTGSEDRKAEARRPLRLRAGTGGEGSAPSVFGNVPVSVTVLAALLAVICLAMTLAPDAVEEGIADRFGLSPARLAAGGAGAGGWFWAIAPLFTHALIHATGTHLLFNLLWLFVFGTPIARRFNSPLRFFSFFALCSAAGGAFFSVFHLNDPTLLVGASGGITGLLGGLVRFAFHRPHSKPESAKGVLPLTDKSVLILSAVIIAMNASVAIFGPGMGAGDADIAWQAHVGGFLFGLIFFPLFDPARR
ncbi:MAG: rhomboid family intramembrane serine protease [Pseudomonadota bacterium]